MQDIMFYFVEAAYLYSNLDSRPRRWARYFLLFPFFFKLINKFLFLIFICKFFFMGLAVRESTSFISKPSFLILLNLGIFKYLLLTGPA